MKVALLDPSLFTAPYDLALMEGIARAESAMALRLYTRELTAGDIESDRIVEHFYRRLPRWLGNSRLVKGLQHPFDMASLWRDLSRWQPDVIHVQWAALPPVDLVFLPKFRQIAPLVLTLHDSNPQNGSPRSRLQVAGSRALLRHFDAIIVHTAQARARAEAAGIAPGRIARIPHGLLHPQTAPCRQGPVPDFTRPLELILFGKLKPYKGADILIRALALVPAALRAECRLRIIGRPYMETAPLVALANQLDLANTVSFEFSYLPDEEIAGLFSGDRVAVFPYREIDSSGVLMTAIAAGCPIIASRLGGFAEILTDGRDALLFSPGDESALAKVLALAIDDGGLRRRLADGVTALRDSIPSWQAIGHGTIALYRTVAERRSLRARSFQPGTRLH
jgi:glycosyltransferase involved in cell wall biosynthesis